MVKLASLSLLMVCVSWLFGEPVFSQEATPNAIQIPIQPIAAPRFSNPVTLDIPVIETPFMFSDSHYGFPSMRQSVELSTDFYQTAHALLGGVPGQEHRRWHVWAIIGFDVFSNYIPLGNSWTHEEWHRAVMTSRGIESYDDVNNIPIGASLIAVSHVGDEDLINLKRDHPADSVRMSSAGMEAQVAQNYVFERRHFFDGSETFDRIVLGINAVSVSLYLNECASGAADRSTDEQNNNDGSDIEKRDFTGLDCTAWVYDLFRPNEPYAARGVHPSGRGIDRYIKNSDLAPYEKSYLSQQVGLSVLNFVDPFVWGFDRFTTEAFGTQWQWNARMAHYITSFGHTVDTTLFLKSDKEKFLVSIHNGFNAARYFPGFTFEWIDHQLPFERYSFSASLTLWNQPEGQSVRSDQASALASIGTELGYSWAPKKSIYAGFDAKTPGWIAGNVYLDRNITLFSGLRFGILE
jgi:hypothetical protein